MHSLSSLKHFLFFSFLPTHPPFDKQSGEDACELIHYGMELVKARRTIEDLNNSLYSAVTFHEMYKIAAQNALDEVGARKRRAAAGKALAARQRLSSPSKAKTTKT